MDHLRVFNDLKRAVYEGDMEKVCLIWNGSREHNIKGIVEEKPKDETVEHFLTTGLENVYNQTIYQIRTKLNRSLAIYPWMFNGIAESWPLMITPAQFSKIINKELSKIFLPVNGKKSFSVRLRKSIPTVAILVDLTQHDIGVYRPLLNAQFNDPSTDSNRKSMIKKLFSDSTYCIGTYYFNNRWVTLSRSYVIFSPAWGTDNRRQL